MTSALERWHQGVPFGARHPDDDKPSGRGVTRVFQYDVVFKDTDERITLFTQYVGDTCLTDDIPTQLAKLGYDLQRPRMVIAI